MLRLVRYFALVWVCGIPGIAQVCTTTQYTGVGTVELSYELSFPGNPVCVPGALTNTLAWGASSTGAAACPLMFQGDGLYWEFSLTYTAGLAEGNYGAGCVWGLGPGFFDTFIKDCGVGDVLCREVWITLWGQFLPVGLYAPGQTVAFGTTSCWPATAQASVTSCTQCPGSPQLACSQGSPKCTASGWSGCTNGGTACPLPPDWNCGPGFSLVCGPSGWTGQCVGSTCGVNCPLIVDLANEGFHLTGWQDDVDFPFTPGGMARIGWTDPAYQNGLLVLDRNGNGRIDDGAELFGNVTPQPPSREPNGFAALAVYDKEKNGGNENDFIDPGDEVFSRLMIWIDKNRDGVSQPEERKPVSEYGAFRIGLSYHRSPFVDDHGNEFRYRGSMWLRRDKKPVAGIYDVFLVSDMSREGYRRRRRCQGQRAARIRRTQNPDGIPLASKTRSDPLEGCEAQLFAARLRGLLAASAGGRCGTIRTCLGLL